MISLTSYCPVLPIMFTILPLVLWLVSRLFLVLPATCTLFPIYSYLTMSYAFWVIKEKIITRFVLWSLTTSIMLLSTNNWSTVPSTPSQISSSLLSQILFLSLWLFMYFPIIPLYTLLDVLRHVIVRWFFSLLRSTPSGNNIVLPCVMHFGMFFGSSIHYFILFISAVQVPVNVFHQKFVILSITGAGQFFPVFNIL